MCSKERNSGVSLVSLGHSLPATFLIQRILPCSLGLCGSSLTQSRTSWGAVFMNIASEARTEEYITSDGTFKMGQPPSPRRYFKACRKVPPRRRAGFSGRFPLASRVFSDTCPHSCQDLSSSNHLSAERCTVSWGSGGDAEAQ